MRSSKSLQTTNKGKIPVVEPDKEFVSIASSGSRSSYRGESAQKNNISTLLKNIDSGVTPYELSSDCLSVRDAILLCQKAYFNVAIFRHTIDIQTEFANSNLHFKGGTAKSRNFFKSWFKKINGRDLAEQFFREWYRSSNFFCYKVNYNIGDEDVARIRSEFGGEILNNLRGKSVPLRYVVLNPADIKVSSSIFGSSDTEYFKFLTPFEKTRLKNPSTEEEKTFVNSLPKDIRDSLQNKSTETKIKLDSKSFISVFSKKQDYEPMSVPIYFPVLFDINLKLELKKVEHEIAKTVDYIILLVTNGDKDNGVDARVFTELKKVLTSESVGRVLVADYTTEAEFVIPDLNKILGPEKYQVVNQDIANGLMNIFFEDQKFANSFVKIKIFLERLNEARTSFLRKFLMVEMDLIAKEIGLENIPTPYFEEINLDEHSELSKIYTRLYELGMLSPKDYLELNETGEMPSFDDILEHQKEFKSHRDKGLFEPIIGGAKDVAGRPAGTKAPQTTKKVSPQKGVGSEDLFKLSGLKDSVASISNLIEKVESYYKETNNFKRLSSKHQDVCFGFAKQIINNENKSDWESSIEKYFNSFVAPTDQSLSISSLALEHNLEDFQAAILFHSK